MYSIRINNIEMYKFCYGFMKDNVNIFELLYSDTDGFIFEIIGENFYELMHKELMHQEFFDLSNFPKYSKYFCNDNKKVPGKTKDENKRYILADGINALAYGHKNITK